MDLDPASLKVTELKAELKKRALPVGGLKKELVDRLTEALRKEKVEAEQDAAEEEQPAEEDGADESSVTVDNATPIAAETSTDTIMENPEEVAKVNGTESTEETVVEEKTEEASGKKDAPPPEATIEVFEEADIELPLVTDVETSIERPKNEPTETVIIERIQASEDVIIPKETVEEQIVKPSASSHIPTAETAEPTPIPRTETPKDPSDVLEPTTSAPTPLQPLSTTLSSQPTQGSIEADLLQRRKRSRTPSVLVDEIEAKKARIHDELPGHDETAMTDVAPIVSKENEAEEERRGRSPERRSSAPKSRSPSPSRHSSQHRSRSRSRSPYRSRSRGGEMPVRQRPSVAAGTKDARFKGLFNKEDNSRIKREEDNADTEEDVQPAIHPATSALYIRELVRPFQENQLRAHLVKLATKPSSDEPEELKLMYLDSIKTHCFAVFNSVQACSRARNGIHGKLFPNEKNRKVLFADFVPEEKVEQWIDNEKYNRTARYVVNYENIPSDDGQVVMTAIHEEARSGGGGMAGSGGGRGSMAGPSIRGAGGGTSAPPLDAPSGPRGSGGRLLQPAIMQVPPGAKVVSLDDLFLSTKTKPKLYYKPVDERVARERLAKVDISVPEYPRRESRGDSWRASGSGFRGGRGGGFGRRGGDSWRGDRDWDRSWVRDGGRGDRRGPYRERNRDRSRSRSRSRDMDRPSRR